MGETDLTIQYMGMYHANMVRDVVPGLQEVMQQEQAPTDTPETISVPNEHVENKAQNTQQKLAEKLKLMQTMMQDMQLQYAAAP